MEGSNFDPLPRGGSPSKQKYDVMGHDFVLGTKIFGFYTSKGFIKSGLKKLVFQVHGDPLFLPNYLGCVERCDI